MSRRLFITADDFGESAAVNDAVFEAYQNGILRFASLMVNEPAAADAARRARSQFPGLGVGLHAVLCNGLSALGRVRWGGWLDADGRFPTDPVRCGMRYFFDRSLRVTIEAELRAQFERFLSLGLSPGHVDGHVNLHVHPVIYPLLARLCREYGFTRLRLPGGELAASLSFRLSPFKQLGEAVTFQLLRRYLMMRHADPRVHVLDRTYGLLRSGLMSEEYLLRLLEGLPPGDTEIYFHPSADPDSEAGESPTESHQSRAELRTLLSPRVREAISASGITLADAGSVAPVEQESAAGPQQLPRVPHDAEGEALLGGKA